MAALLATASEAHTAFGGQDTDLEPLDVDAPIPFSGSSFLRSIEATAEMLNVSEHTETLIIRIRSLLKDSRIKQVLCDSEEIRLEDWLGNSIGSSAPDQDAISIIDLSLVPTEIIHVAIAVIARVIFESLQRYRKTYKAVLPTVLVMEEAHTFIKQQKDNSDVFDAGAICCQVFERIAREGRKFGLGLVLAEILSIVVDWKSERFSGQAAASSTRSPFTNFTPASTSGMNLNPSNLRQPCSASLQSL